MANKPIISVDVDDSKFKEFFALFQKYQEGMNEIPESWGAVNNESAAAINNFAKAMKQANTQIQKAAHGMHVVTTGTNKADKAQKGFLATVHRSAGTMKKLGKESATVAKHIFGIGKFLFKFGAIGSILGGAVSLFGITSLAESAVSRQRVSRGLGLTPGQVTAFKTDYGRYVDPSILQSVVEARANAAQAPLLAKAAGLNMAQISAMPADIIAQRVVMRAHHWWNTVGKQNPLVAQQNLQAQGFGAAGLSVEGMQRLGATSTAALARAQQQYQRDRVAFNIGGGTVSAWYQLTRQISVAGHTIETELTNKLVALGPSLGSLVNSLTRNADALISGFLNPSVVRQFADGIEDFAKFIGSQNFVNDMKEMGNAAVTFAKIIEKVGGWLGITTAQGKTKSEPTFHGNLNDQRSLKLDKETVSALKAIAQRPVHVHVRTSPTNNIWSQANALGH